MLKNKEMLLIVLSGKKIRTSSQFYRIIYGTHITREKRLGGYIQECQFMVVISVLRLLLFPGHFCIFQVY